MLENSGHGLSHEPRQDSERPSWQAQPCPPWCVQEHRENDFPEDRKHQSHAITAPAVWLDQDTSDDAEDHLVAEDFHLLSWQQVDGIEIIVTIADDDYDVCLEITAESMRRLHGGLGELLGNLS